MLNRREFLAALATSAAGAVLPKVVGKGLASPLTGIVPRRPERARGDRTQLLRTEGMIGRVTDQDAVVNVISGANPGEGVLVRVRWALADEPLPASPYVSPTFITADPLSRIEAPVTDLAPNQDYAYQVEYASAAAPDDWRTNGVISSFQSQKTSGRSFGFSVMADAHWGQIGKVVPGEARWATGVFCLRQIARENACDFAIDLGDSPFTTSAEFALSRDQYLDYRDLLTPITRKMPVYLALGNHECEAGFYQRGTDDGEQYGALWNKLEAEDYRQLVTTRARLMCIPNPRGDTYPEGGEGAPGYDSLNDWLGEPGPWNDGAPTTHLQNFYAWTWGDALFVVLDPFRYTLVGSVVFPNSPAQYTLGPTQLQWLEDVLAASTATWKFIFAHHQVGGGLINRGGFTIEDGGTGYAYGRGSAIEADRAGVEQMLIHEMMLQHGAQFFVYGHDHGFSHSAIDGVHYLCCGRPTFLNRWWTADGMTESYGDLLIQGQDKPWMQLLHSIVGYARFEVEPGRVVLQWLRTGFSYSPMSPTIPGYDRDWNESWAGRSYDVDSPHAVTVATPPKQVDGVRTIAGAEIPGLFEPPTGVDYRVPLGRLSWSSPPGRIALDNFPEMTAVVDAYPEVVYEMQFDI